jgi:hypothetical protein
MTRRRDFASYDAALVDHLAVRWACQGTAMRLNRDERVLAVRLMCGRVPTQDIARRIRTYPEEVSRILRALDTVKCPLCQQFCWHDDGVLRQHAGKPDGVCFSPVDWCAMGGCHHQDRAAYQVRRGGSAVPLGSAARRQMVTAS